MKQKIAAIIGANIHWPYNTDDPVRLSSLFYELNSQDLKVIFSILPRTRNLFLGYGLDLTKFHNLHFMEPASYIQKINLLANSRALITDSGGMKKEAYFLRVPCVTIRSETEWHETLENGWNALCFEDLSLLSDILHTSPGQFIPNLYGTGIASEIIRLKITEFLNTGSYRPN